jgi:Ca2+-binding RTX toxin-like protein
MCGTNNYNDQLISVTSDKKAHEGVRSVIFGGAGNDVITSDGQCALQCGDHCSLSSIMNQRLLTSSNTSSATSGGNDELSFYAADGVHATSIMIGGDANDSIQSFGAVNGDAGTISFVPYSSIVAIDALSSNICWTTASLSSLSCVSQLMDNDGNDHITIFGISTQIGHTASVATPPVSRCGCDWW